jgi:DNA-binding transcriptional ArsR family regulator
MDHLSSAFSALSDPTRRAILDRLMQGEASFTELADPFEISRPAVVKHLRALEKAGLIAKRGAKARPVYSLTPERLSEAMDWLERRRRHWEGSLDRLGRYVRDIQNGEGGTA